MIIWNSIINAVNISILIVLSRYIAYPISIIMGSLLSHCYYTNISVLKTKTNFYLKLKNLILVPKMLILIMKSLSHAENTLIE